MPGLTTSPWKTAYRRGFHGHNALSSRAATTRWPRQKQGDRASNGLCAQRKTYTCQMAQWDATLIVAIAPSRGGVAWESTGTALYKGQLSRPIKPPVEMALSQRAYPQHAVFSCGSAVALQHAALAVLAGSSSGLQYALSASGLRTRSSPYMGNLIQAVEGLPGNSFQRGTSRPSHHLCRVLTQDMGAYLGLHS
jgi:hypothetical protein